MARILVAEDDALLLRAIQDALELADYHVCAVANGVQGLQALSHFRPDLIVTDVAMPEMGGFELCRRVRGESPGAAVPFVFMSVTDASQLGEQFDKHSVFLKKPFGVEELLKAVRRLLTWPSLPSISPDDLSLVGMDVGWRTEKGKEERDGANGLVEYPF